MQNGPRHLKRHLKRYLERDLTFIYPFCLIRTKPDCTYADNLKFSDGPYLHTDHCSCGGCGRFRILPHVDVFLTVHNLTCIPFLSNIKHLIVHCVWGRNIGWVLLSLHACTQLSLASWARAEPGPPLVINIINTRAIICFTCADLRIPLE